MDKKERGGRGRGSGRGGRRGTGESRQSNPVSETGQGYASVQQPQHHRSQYQQQGSHVRRHETDRAGGDSHISSQDFTARDQQFPGGRGAWGRGGQGSQREERSQFYRRSDDQGNQRGRGRGDRGSNRGRGSGYGRGRGKTGWQGDRDWYREQHGEDFGQKSQEIPFVVPEQPSSSTDTEDNLQYSFSALQVSSPSSGQVKESITGGDNKSQWVIPLRKNYGTHGRAIEIEVNHLRISLKNKNIMAIHYDCAFKPDKISKKVARLVMETMRLKHYSTSHPGFDGKKNLYSIAPLFSGDKLTDTVEPPQLERCKVEVTLTQVGVVDLSQLHDFTTVNIPFPQAPIQVLDIVLRSPSALRLTQVGRSFFTPPSPGQSFHLGNGMELWYGFFQSAIVGSNIYLNVDVAHKGFPEPKNLIEVILDIKSSYIRRGEVDRKGLKESLKNEGLGRYETEDFIKHIKGLKVRYQIGDRVDTSRRYGVNGIKSPCNKYSFDHNGQMVTVEQYFAKEKNYRLQFPCLPCIHVGNPQRNICLPPELCTVMEGQVITKKLDKNQTSAMIKAAAQPPHKRKPRIAASIEMADFNSDPCVQEFGVTVAQEFEKVPGRVLDSPTLNYQNCQIRPQNGVWRAGKFLTPKNLDRWVILTVCARRNERYIIDVMKDAGKKVGMNIAEPLACDAIERYELDVFGSLIQKFKHYKEEEVQVIMVMVPANQSDVYGKVKAAAEVFVGVLTQCIRDFTKVNLSTMSNILLKINAKLNGTNQTVLGRACPPAIAQLLDGTMFMGADVTHPSPDQQKIPSVAAVTASHDHLAFQYNMMWRLQPPRQEIIGDLRAIVRNQIKYYMSKNSKREPKKIIFYRDGVSEGQFVQVLEAEMNAILSACLDVLQHPIPVTFIVVQKRHHTRFFPKNGADMDENGNVLAGTVVDTLITHPRESDFYLVSHASLQGTSRPTKYHKLWDDNNIDEDALQELTFYLCFHFTRCNRSVSYPAPTYYAHLAAARGKVYLEGSNINIDDLQKEMDKRKVKQSFVEGFPMHYV